MTDEFCAGTNGLGEQQAILGSGGPLIWHGMAESGAAKAALTTRVK